MHAEGQRREAAECRSDAYNTERDVPESLDYEFMASIVTAVARVVKQSTGGR